MKHLVAAAPGQRTIADSLRDVSNAWIDTADAVGYWVKHSARVASDAETLRLAFTIQAGGFIGYLQVLANDAMHPRTELSLISAQQPKVLAKTTLFNVLHEGS